MTQTTEKNSIKSLFYVVEAGPGHGSEDIKKDCDVNCFDFFFFSVFLTRVMGGKITITISSKELH